MNRIAGISSAHKVIGACVLATIVAAFLPWVSIFGVSVYGIEGDGVVTLIVGIAALLVLASHIGFGPVKVGPRLFLIAQGACGLIVFMVGAFHMNRFAASGLYLTLAAGIVWLAAVALAWRGARRPSLPVAHA